MSYESPDRKLLSYLSGRLGAGVDFASPPARLSGGFDTTIMAFRLANAPAEYSGELILRWMAGIGRPDQVRREAAAHAALVAQGFAAPRVLAAEPEGDVLGAPFLIMERLPGCNMVDNVKQSAGRIFRLTRDLAHTHVLMHRVPGEALLASAREHGLDPALFTLAGELGRLAARVERSGLRGLERGIDWLARNQPSAAREVVCHGDYHPLNVVMDGERVAGVVDWSQAIVAEPAFDIAATRVLLLYPSAGAQAWLHWVVAPVRALAARRYLGFYRAESAVDLGNLDYFEAFRILAGLIFAGERPGPRNQWGMVLPRICRRFEKLSGVGVYL